MQRHEVLALLGELKLTGMLAVYDEIVAAGVKRKHTFDRILGDLLNAEKAEKKARSIRYQMGIAKLPLAKELADFSFEGTPINEQLVRELAGGTFLDTQRNAVAVGGTGTGKSHLAIAIARSCVRQGAKAHASSMSSIWLISCRPRPNSTRPAASPTGSPASTSWSSMNWATCHSLPLAGSYSSISSAGSTSGPRSSSPPTWHSASGLRSSLTPR